MFKHPNIADGQTEDFAAQFVDDNQQQKSALGLLRHYSGELVLCQNAQEVDALLVRVTNDDANHWCQYSFCAGGFINTSKNFGRISYRTVAECPGDVSL